MNSRKRVALAIGFHETDRVPIGEIAITDGVVKTCLGIPRVGFEERVEFVERLGIDAICIVPDWPKQLSGLPDPVDPRWTDLVKWAAQTDRYVFTILNGVFSWVVKLQGFEAFLKQAYKKSRVLIDLIQKVETLNISLANYAVDKGTNGILIADDIAYNKGTTVGPKILRDIFFPSLARQLKKIIPLKIPVFFHSDGNLNSIIEDLVDIGFHGLQCLESAAGMDLSHIKAVYGKKICLWGNLDPNDLFLPRNEEELNKKITEIIDGAASGGGFIFGTSSGLVDGMRAENIEAVYQAVRFKGRSYI